MEKTGNTTVSMDALDALLWRTSETEKRALNYKKQGRMDDYWMELTSYIGVKSALEQLGLIVREDYDFNKAV